MTIAEPRWTCRESSRSRRFALMPLLPEPTKSSENILWGLANFFLQLFVWGSLAGLFVYLASIIWEGLFVLAFISGLVGIIWAVVPLWLILYPMELNKGKQDRDAGWWVALVFTLFLFVFIIFLIAA